MLAHGTVLRKNGGALQPRLNPWASLGSVRFFSEVAVAFNGWGNTCSIHSWSETKQCTVCKRWKIGTPQRIAANFLRKVQKGRGCWKWLGAMQANGYGHHCIDRSHSMKAARAAWVIFRGPIQKGLQVCHTCDNRACVRLSHLFLGTPKENIHDMIHKGRNRSKLTIPQVLKIRRHVRMGEDSAALAKKYGVSRITIWRIGSGKGWASVAD